MVAALAFLLAVVPALTSAITIDVRVGFNGTLAYDPANTHAVVGDVVTFHFNPKNHTVTQSSFANPCGPLNGGINSGFMPVGDATGDLPTFSVTVNDTRPVWFYCAQGAGTNKSHCAQGMVFAINCGDEGSENSFSNFKAAAALSGSTPTDGGLALPPSPTASLATQVVTLGSDVWTTTYNSYPGSPGPTPASAEGTVHDVSVGDNGLLAFSPASVIAKPRDKIRFTFHPKNHSVTTSSFKTPCLSDGVFDSGFKPVSNTTTDFPSIIFNITNTDPIYMYCKQVNHCQQGMVFAINAPEPWGIQAFQDRAKNNAVSNSSSGSPSPSPSSTPSNSTSDGSQIKFGFASFLFPLALFGFAL